MKRDPHISKLMRESGIARAPENLTSRVMDLIGPEPVKTAYKPIIGKVGRWTIILIIVGIIIVSLVFSEPGGRTIGISEGLSNLDLQLPQFNFNLGFLSKLNLSTGLVSALVALFILVLSDAGLRRRKLA